MSLNAAAHRAAEDLLADAAAFGAAVETRAGVRVVDCGVRVRGGDAAGLVMARVALAGRAAVDLLPPGAAAGAWPGCPWPTVSVSSAEPVAACLASQYAGWKVSVPGYFAMASGPIRAAIGREELFTHIGLTERPDVAVGLLEAGKLPPESVCAELAVAAGVPPERVVLLVARTASAAGTLQVIARSLETALHKLHDLAFDLTRIRSGRGVAPLAPVPADDLVAIGRTNDAILYGGTVELEVSGDDASLEAIGPRAVSRASDAYGKPFLELFERAGRDFYALDPALFAPAALEFVNVDTGRRQRFGGVAPEIVARSFTDPSA